MSILPESLPFSSKAVCSTDGKRSAESSGTSTVNRIERAKTGKETKRENNTDDEHVASKTAEGDRVSRPIGQREASCAKPV